MWETVASSCASARQCDPVPRQYLTTSPVRDQQAIDISAPRLPNPFYPAAFPVRRFRAPTRLEPNCCGPILISPASARDSKPGLLLVSLDADAFREAFRKGYTLEPVLDVV